MRGVKNAVYTVLIILLCIFGLAKTSITSLAVSEALERCLTVIIPSLYAMMIISVLIAKSGIIHLFSVLSGFSSRVFGMEGEVFAVFVFSMLGGYPTGTKMLCEMSENGSIDRKRAELLSGLCYGAGPAFIFGCISGRLYGTAVAGKVILLSVLCANILVALLISPLTRKSCKKLKGRSIDISMDILSESVADSGRSMMSICVAITAFSVIISFLRYSGAVTLAGSIISFFTGKGQGISESIVSALLDVTAVGTFPENDFSLLPVLTALVSFGGICVIFQLKSIVSGKLSLKPLILTRIAVSLTSGAVCRLIAPLRLKGEIMRTSVEYGVKAEGYRSCSPVPSVMLIIMTAMFFSEYRKNDGFSLLKK